MQGIAKLPWKMAASDIQALRKCFMPKITNILSNLREDAVSTSIIIHIILLSPHIKLAHQSLALHTTIIPPNPTLGK